MLRVSSYTIFVPIPHETKYILVHGYTGSLDLLNGDLAARLLSSQSSNRSASIDDLTTGLSNYLEERGYLTRKTVAEEADYSREIAAVSRKRQLSLPPKIYLMPTLECNLRCTYCFEHPIRSTGRREGWASTLLNRDRIAAAFRAMDELYGNSPTKSVTLYGGEALMPENRQCIEQILQSARDGGYSVMAATHGRDLDEYLDLLGHGGISALHVPVDGVQETHDRLRYGPGRSPTFKRIITNLHLALARGVWVRMRVNVNRQVLEQLDEFADFLETEGFTRSSLFSVYLNAVFPTVLSSSRQCQSQSYVTECEIAAALAKSTRLSRLFSGYPVIHERIYSLFSEEPHVALSPTHCCAGGGTLIFDPLGRIYPCNFMVGEQGHQIGTFYPRIAWDEAVRRTWQERSVENIQAVGMCKYALLCGGGSPYDAYTRTQTIVDKSCNCEKFEKTFAGYVVSAYHRFSDHAGSTLDDNLIAGGQHVRSQ